MSPAAVPSTSGGLRAAHSGCITGRRSVHGRWTENGPELTVTTSPELLLRHLPVTPCPRMQLAPAHANRAPRSRYLTIHSLQYPRTSSRPNRGRLRRFVILPMKPSKMRPRPIASAGPPNVAHIAIYDVRKRTACAEPRADLWRAGSAKVRGAAGHAALCATQIVRALHHPSRTRSLHPPSTISRCLRPRAWASAVANVRSRTGA